MRRPLASVRRDQRGATLIEFAIVAPAFFMLLMGSFDIGYQIYIRVIVNGALQKAARESSIETGPRNLTAIDNRLKDQIRNIIPQAEPKIERLNYYSYNDVGRPETYSDGNGNGQCDNNEPFEDENSNGVWDRDVGTTGVGGAKDVVQYRVTLTYDRIFPLWRMLNQPQQSTVVAESVLKNQPYDRQQVRLRRSLTC